ncbi:MAG: LPS-assembly protein LptD [Methylococcales bacterium]
MANLVILSAVAVSMGFYLIEARAIRSVAFGTARSGVGILLVLACGLRIVFAETTHAGWDCSQDKASGEWVCKTDRARQEKLPKPATKDAGLRAVGGEGEAAGPETAPVVTEEASPAPAETPEKSAEPSPTATLHQPDDSAKPAITGGESTKSARSAETEEGQFREEDLEEPLPSLAKQPGWTCKSDPGDTGWNCNLVGPDPAGQAHPVSKVNESLLGSATFDNRQELIFKDMLSKTPYNPWDQCTTRLGPRPPRVSKQVREKTPMNINADYSDIYEREVVTFTGNVDVTRADERVLADQASYNKQSETLNARGNVHYRNQDYSVYSDTAFINLDQDQGKLRNSQFIYGTTPARGRAKLAERESKSLSHYIDAAYTTCAPGNQDWTLETGTLDIDRDEGVAAATNAWLEISGVPIAYVPYFEFPIDDRRKSGILNPVFGLTRNTGFDFTLPYYWNIAPNYDATIVPRIMTKRGLLLGGEFRYLTESSVGRFNGQIIPYDTSAKKTRGAVSLVNSSQITPSLQSNLDLNWLSDVNYLNQISNTITLTNFSHVRSTANAQYNGPGIGIFAQLENYQTINPSIPPAARPYRRLPQILVTAARNILDTGGLATFRGEQVYFQRSNTLTSHRSDLKPDISWLIESTGGFITPKVALDFTQYFLQSQPAGTPDSITRVLPLVSLDSGLFFEREFDFGGSEMIQTLEPRMYYLYVPAKNQDNIPLFDTSEFDFTILQLFRDNRFNSADRIGDANQLSVALTSRILEPETGIQRLDGTLGTIAYFKDRNVQLSRSFAPNTDPTSSLVAELNGVVTEDLSFRSGLQWNPYLGRFTRGLATLHYQDDENRILNLSYRYRLDPTGIVQLTPGILQQLPPGTLNIDQADGSVRWPLFAGLAGVGRMQYSFPDGKILESFLGFEKESCCWRFRIIGRYWIQTIQTTSGVVAGTGKANTGIFAQLEFKGFASFGDKVDQFLQRNIAGYQEPE